MKTLFGMMLLLAATNAVACIGAPLDEEEGTAEATTAQTDEPKAEPTEAAQAKPGEAKVETTSGVCTAAELAACRRADPYGSGCAIENGHPICLFY